MLLAPLLATFACVEPGDSELTCGEGTHEEGGACVVDSDSGKPDTGDSDADSDSDSDADSDADADTDADSDGDADTDSDTDTDTGTAPDFDVCGDGSAKYTEIQDAVDDAKDGDTIYVCAGTYEPVDIARLDVTIIGEGSASTRIESSTRTAVIIEEATVNLQGFTLDGFADEGMQPEDVTAGLLADGATISTNDIALEGEGTYNILTYATDATWEGLRMESVKISLGLVAVNGGTQTLRHSWFVGNDPPEVDQTLEVAYFEIDHVEISNNVFMKNLGTRSGHIVDVRASAGDAWVYNNVIWGNDCESSGTVVVLDGPVTFENNIVSENSGTGVLAGRSADLGYNDLWRNTAEISGGSNTDGISDDPAFVDPEHGDFTLDPAWSDCIDGGDPKTGYNDADGTINDMGAYGGPYSVW